MTIFSLAAYASQLRVTPALLKEYKLTDFLQASDFWFLWSKHALCAGHCARPLASDPEAEHDKQTLLARLTNLFASRLR